MVRTKTNLNLYIFVAFLFAFTCFGQEIGYCAFYSFIADLGLFSQFFEMEINKNLQLLQMVEPLNDSIENQPKKIIYFRLKYYNYKKITKINRVLEFKCARITTKPNR